MNVKGKVCVVTGAASGIGEAVARAYAEAGARGVVIADLKTSRDRLAKVAGERGRLYLKRQELLDLGPVAEVFLTEIVHRHRFTWQGEVEQLHGALVQHGPTALHRALAMANERELYGAPHVLRLLAKEVA